MPLRNFYAPLAAITFVLVRLLSFKFIHYDPNVEKALYQHCSKWLSYCFSGSQKCLCQQLLQRMFSFLIVIIPALFSMYSEFFVMFSGTFRHSEHILDTVLRIIYFNTVACFLIFYIFLITIFVPMLIVMAKLFVVFLFWRYIFFNNSCVDVILNLLAFFNLSFILLVYVFLLYLLLYYMFLEFFQHNFEN